MWNILLFPFYGDNPSVFSLLGNYGLSWRYVWWSRLQDTHQSLGPLFWSVVNSCISMAASVYVSLTLPEGTQPVIGERTRVEFPICVLSRLRNVRLM
jgi:hypothetical protein